MHCSPSTPSHCNWQDHSPCSGPHNTTTIFRHTKGPTGNQTGHSANDIILFSTLWGHGHSASFASKSGFVSPYISNNYNERHKYNAGNWKLVHNYGLGSGSTTLQHHLTTCHLAEWATTCNRANITISGNGTLGEMIVDIEMKTRLNQQTMPVTMDWTSHQCSQKLHLSMLSSIWLWQRTLWVSMIHHWCCWYSCVILTFEVSQHHQICVTAVALSNAP